MSTGEILLVAMFFATAYNVVAGIWHTIAIIRARKLFVVLTHMAIESIVYQHLPIWRAYAGVLAEIDVEVTIRPPGSRQFQVRPDQQ